MGEFSLLSSLAVGTFGKQVVFLSERRCEDGEHFLFCFSLFLPLECVGLSCVQGKEDGVLLRRVYVENGAFSFLAVTVR